jgi:hypothetical protein
MIGKGRQVLQRRGKWWQVIQLGFHERPQNFKMERTGNFAPRRRLLQETVHRPVSIVRQQASGASIDSGAIRSVRSLMRQKLGAKGFGTVER